MIQKNITKGSKVARITSSDGVNFFTRLYVNNGETATQIQKHAKTLKGAIKQAEKMLG